MNYLFDNPTLITPRELLLSLMEVLFILVLFPFLYWPISFSENSKSNWFSFRMTFLISKTFLLPEYRVISQNVLDEIKQGKRLSTCSFINLNTDSSVISPVSYFNSKSNDY